MRAVSFFWWDMFGKHTDFTNFPYQLRNIKEMLKVYVETYSKIPRQKRFSSERSLFLENIMSRRETVS